MQTGTILNSDKPRSSCNLRIYYILGKFTVEVSGWLHTVLPPKSRPWGRISQFWRISTANLIKTVIFLFLHLSFDPGPSQLEYNKTIVTPNKSSISCLDISKGHLISKCLFGVFNFLQKPNKNKSHSSRIEFVRPFFGGNVGLKKTFWFCLNRIFLVHRKGILKRHHQANIFFVWKEVWIIY